MLHNIYVYARTKMKNRTIHIVYLQSFSSFSLSLSLSLSLYRRYKHGIHTIDVALLPQKHKLDAREQPQWCLDNRDLK